MQDSVRLSFWKVLTKSSSTLVSVLKQRQHLICLPSKSLTCQASIIFCRIKTQTKIEVTSYRLANSQVKKELRLDTQI